MQKNVKYSNVIKEAKRIYYNKRILKSGNKCKPLGISFRIYLVNNILKLIYKT
jgi:hypothetical protein